MSTDPALYIAAAAILGSTLGFWAAALLASRRQRSQYNRGWTAGKDFATRQFHDTLQDHIIRRIP
jgi:hypothetical protein